MVAGITDRQTDTTYNSPPQPPTDMMEPFISQPLALLISVSPAPQILYHSRADRFPPLDQLRHRLRCTLLSIKIPPHLAPREPQQSRFDPCPEPCRLSLMRAMLCRHRCRTLASGSGYAGQLSPPRRPLPSFPRRCLEVHAAGLHPLCWPSVRAGHCRGQLEVLAVADYPRRSLP